VDGFSSISVYNAKGYSRPKKEILDGTWKFPEAQPVR
jgi:hypothetical protein